jgi:hypothetical protein
MLGWIERAEDKGLCSPAMKLIDLGTEKVADVIDITERLPAPDNLIVSHPLEFRKGEWHTGYALMCTRDESDRYERHRIEAFRAPGHQHIALVPNHLVLDGGYHYTVLGLFRYRSEEAKMRRVYRLAGLMECVTNAPSAILRTDLLRRFYKSILEERKQLDLAWRGNVHHFLLPIHPHVRNPSILFQNIAGAESLKGLYEAIDSETNAQFNILRSHYVFYLPSRFLREDSHTHEM